MAWQISLDDPFYYCNNKQQHFNYLSHLVWVDIKEGLVVLKCPEWGLFPLTSQKLQNEYIQYNNVSQLKMKWIYYLATKLKQQNVKVLRKEKTTLTVIFKKLNKISGLPLCCPRDHLSKK